MLSRPRTTAKFKIKSSLLTEIVLLEVFDKGYEDGAIVFHIKILAYDLSQLELSLI